MSNTKKYELILDSSRPNTTHSMYRVKYLINGKYFKAGDIGGFVSGEDNLSHEGDCCILDDAKVLGRATIYEDAVVMGRATVNGNVHISGYSQISGSACISNYSGCSRLTIKDDAKIYGDCSVLCSGMIHGITRIYDSCSIDCLSANLYDCNIYGRAKLLYNVILDGNAHVFSDAVIQNCHITGGYHRVSPLVIQGSRHKLVLTSTGHILIGCKLHSFEEWLEKYRKIGTCNAYTATEKEQYISYIKFIIKMSKHYNLEP